MHSQYHAALAMLAQSIERCPEELWSDQKYPSPFWRIAYHALFFTHLYIQPTIEQFKAWPQHREEAEMLGSLPWPPHRKALDVPPYSKEEVLEYLAFCKQQVSEKMSTLDLEAGSGFDWLAFSKLETLLYELRHLQQHIGELDERLGVQGIQVDWVGKVDAD